MAPMAPIIQDTDSSRRRSPRLTASDSDSSPKRKPATPKTPLGTTKVNALDNGIPPAAEPASVRDMEPAEYTEDGRLKTFLWVGYEEPHAARRKEMLKKYPEIKKLMRAEPLTKYYVLFFVTLQMSIAYLVSRNPDIMWTWKFWLLAYAVGGTLTNSLVLAIHEVTHFLAFKSPLPNKLLACFANIPIVFPFCVEFKKYHMDHHRFQGVDGIDGDVPTELEARLLDNVLGKAFFLTFQIFFYAFRPLLAATPVSYKTPQTIREWVTSWYALLFSMQAVAISLVMYFWGKNAIFYLVASLVLSGSLHPMAGHYLAEHFVVDVEGRSETYSYYGPWNALAFNVGYHNEHHDFANIPWTLLPELRKIAPEFYETLPQCTSWPGMMVKFFTDPGVGMRSRIKRRNMGNMVGWRGSQAKELRD